MNRSIDNKRPIEQILVGKIGAQDSALGQAGGETLTDSTTGLVDLNEGEILVLSSGGWGSVANNTAIAPADTKVDSPEIYLVRGNKDAKSATSTNPYPLDARRYEKTSAINAAGSILYNYKAAARPTFDTWVIGDAVGSAGAINILDEYEYAFKISFFGRDIDESHAGAQKPDAYTPRYISKDYTTLGHTAAEATDDIIQNLVFDVNLNSTLIKFNKANYGSNKPIVGFAVDSTGTNGIDPQAASVGDFIPVVNTAIGLRGITMTHDLIQSFVNADATAWTAGATIVPIDLTLAGDAAAAGSDLLNPSGVAYNTGVIVSGKADQIALLALDRDLAFEDRIPYVKNRIEVGLLDGFNSDTVSNVRAQKAFEGQGTSRQLTIEYDNTARQRQYDQYRGFEELKIQYPNPVEDGVFYDQVTITHYHADRVGVDTIVKPFSVKIWIPNAENAGTGVLTPDADQVALVTGVIKPWVDSASNTVNTSV